MCDKTQKMGVHRLWWRDGLMLWRVAAVVSQWVVVLFFFFFFVLIWFLVWVLSYDDGGCDCFWGCGGGGGDWFAVGVVAAAVGIGIMWWCGWYNGYYMEWLVLIVGVWWFVIFVVGVWWLVIFVVVVEEKKSLGGKRERETSSLYYFIRLYVKIRTGMLGELWNGSVEYIKWCLKM